jgi:hypothetical protein
VFPTPIKITICSNILDKGVATIPVEMHQYSDALEQAKCREIFVQQGGCQQSSSPENMMADGGGEGAWELEG